MPGMISKWHFTWGKNKVILVIFRSRGCLSGEEDHQALGDPSPNPTSMLVILDKSLSPLIPICHFRPAQAKEEHTKAAKIYGTYKEQKDKENAPSTSAASAVLALLLLPACCPSPSLLAHVSGEPGCWRAFRSTVLGCQTSLWKLGQHHASRGLKKRQNSKNILQPAFFLPCAWVMTWNMRSCVKSPALYQWLCSLCDMQNILSANHALTRSANL